MAQPSVVGQALEMREADLLGDGIDVPRAVATVRLEQRRLRLGARPGVHGVHQRADLAAGGEGGLRTRRARSRSSTGS